MKALYTKQILTNTIRFLQAKKWKLTPHPNPFVSYFESEATEDGEYESLVLPASIELSDSSLRIHQALEHLCEIEGINVESLTTSLTHWDQDIFRAHIDNQNYSINSLPLGTASSILERLKSFMGHAAYNEFEPRRYAPKAGAISNEFISHCRFGHTFKGSFGLQIECPIPNIAHLAIDPELIDPPFERKVMERIAIGYVKLQQSVEKDDASILIDNYKTGFNANMLELLAGVYESLDSLSINYDLCWSPELTPKKSATLPQEIKFDGRAYDLAKYAYSELEKENIIEQTTITSTIVSLKSELPPSQEGQDVFEHVITLNWEKERGNFVSLKIPLPSHEYKLACDAHKEGRKILVRGIPEKQGKFWVLTLPSQISFPP